MSLQVSEMLAFSLHGLLSPAKVDREVHRKEYHRWENYPERET
jgi:hypothetical protein